MGGWVASLSAEYWNNWEICLRDSWLGTGAPRGGGVRAGDEIFIWRSGVGLVAYCVAEADAEAVTATSHVPWPNPAKYRYVWPISVRANRDSAVVPSWKALDELAGIGGIPASQFPPVREENLPRIRSLFGGEYRTTAGLDAVWTAVDVEDLQQDNRESAMRAISKRRGQRGFRSSLLRSYGGACAISGSRVNDVLEAAHISPYRGVHTNRIDNGVLLRADFHTLFDLYRVTILPSGHVRVDPALRGTDYEQVDGNPAGLPTAEREKPGREVLQWHNEQCGWLAPLTHGT
jgi:putative restriction endonuclease